VCVVVHPCSTKAALHLIRYLIHIKAEGWGKGSKYKSAFEEKENLNPSASMVCYVLEIILHI